MKHLSLLASLVIFSILVTSCEKNSSAKLDDFNGYIYSYTAEPISACGEISVGLNFTPEPSLIQQLDWNKVLSVKPPIDAKAYYNRHRNAVVINSPPIEHNKKYTAIFNLGALTEVTRKLQFFEIPIERKVQVWNFHASHPEVKSMDFVDYTGHINYEDCEPDKTVIENGFTAKQGDNKLHIQWKHERKEKKSNFVIKNIKRTDKQEVIKITLSMASIGENEQAVHELIIPSKADFGYMRHVINDNDHMSIFFSDPLDRNQNLTGLFNIKGREINKINIEFNRVDLYFSSNKYGYYDLEILPGISNQAGFPLRDKTSQKVFFNPPMPFVEFAEKGHILPTTNAWKVPVKMVSTSGFRLRLLKVYERNIHQYFQNNRQELAHQNSLEKVGRIVLDTVYQLKQEDLFSESIHLLDLTQQVKREPRALYKLFLTIPTELNAYPCEDPIIQKQQDRVDRINFEQSYTVYYNDSDRYYSGQHFRDNASKNREYQSSPCNANYFNDILDQRILMCTDVGIVLKYEPEKHRYFAYVSNISDSEALANAKVVLYDYQGNELTTGKSNSDGVVYLNTKEIPFLVKATSPDGQAVYMHVSDDKALSLSTFQVEGKNWGSKSKLFFYGERDVWRPGDSIYMQCIYFDEKNNLPDRFPVQLTLMDPRGRIVEEWVVNEHKMGLFDIRFKTDINAPTGLWKVSAFIGNETHKHPVRVETIRPNRLKFEMTFANEKMISNDDQKNAKLDVKWMHGLEAKGLKTEVWLKQYALKNPFGEYFENFTFDDPFKKYKADLGMIKSQLSDNDGQLAFSIPLQEANRYPSQMRLAFSLRSFEKGGAFSTDVKSIKYSPYQDYVGVKWPGNRTDNNFIMESGKSVQLICVDEEGNRIDGEVEITIYHITNAWWYQYGQNSMNYSAIKNKFTAQSTKKTLKVNKEGLPYVISGNGRKLIEISSKSSGHSVARQLYIHDPNYRNKGDEEMSQLEVLPFLVEPTKYKVGDVLNFELPPSTYGKYLITVENGGAILYDELRSSDPNQSTSIAINITEQMAPNAYVHVHYIAAYDAHMNHRPLRLFGIQAIQVHAPESILEPEITLNKELRADETFNIKIREKSGKKMAYTIAIVDEGLLDLTQFTTPDPWSYFFSKEALNIKTWDMYRDIFHRFLGEYKSLLAVGGDESGGISNEAQAQRFKPAVKFLGPFMLEPGEEANHQAKISEYVGSVRTMVIGTNGQAFGQSKTESKVLKPLMLYATLPRVLGPGEALQLPVTVFAMKDHIKDVQLEIKCSDASVLKNGNLKDIRFDKVGEQDLSFDIETPENVGVLNFEIIARSGNEVAMEKVEIDVRASSAAIIKSQNYLTSASKDTDISFQAFGMEGTNSAKITLSRGLNFTFEPFVDKLSNYPHGCLEQTISAVFPQLYLNKMDLLNDPQKMAFRQKYKAALQRLRTLQQDDGGFSYWPGGNKANAWGTSYAVQFLLEAKRMAYEVPDAMLKRAINYQYKAADRWVIPSSNNRRYIGNLDLDQAYRLYALVLAGKPNYGAMNRLRLVPNLSNASRWMLAHAMTLVGEEDAADLLMKHTSTAVGEYRELSQTFGSQVRDQALILRILLERGDKLQSKKLIDELTPYFDGTSSRPLSTQEIAQCMIAFSLFVGNLEIIEQEVPFEIRQNNELILDGNLGEKSLSQEVSLNGKKVQKLKLTNRGDTEIYSSLITKGTPLRDESKAENSDLEMTVIYKDIDGKVIDFKSLAQGQDYTVNIKLKHPGARLAYDNMALSLIMPPGCEIINTRLQSDITFNEGSSFDYKDVRDDRVYTYFSLGKNETKEFRYLINASYAGKYWVPSVFAEAMYDGEINAKSQGFWTEVKAN